MQLEVGKKYKTRSGDIVTIYDIEGWDDYLIQYPIRAVSNLFENHKISYSRTGRYVIDADSALDIMEEITNN